MTIPNIPNRGATLGLAVFFLIANLANALYAAHGLPPSGAFLLFWYLGSALVVTYWILADSRRLGLPGSVDQGWFVLAVWPVSLVYHLFKTRRWRGAITLAGLVGLFALTYGISLLAFFAIRRGGK